MRQTRDQYYELRKRTTADAWELLDTAMSEDLKGIFGPGDFNFFKKNSYRDIEYRGFMSHMRKLEELGVIGRAVHGGTATREKEPSSP